MAPLKFEENIKESLSKRSIEPSEGSWDKLASKLDGASPKKKTPIWWAIAAGFVGLVLIGTLLFKGEGDNQQQELVETNNTPEQIIKQEQEVVVPNTTEVVEAPKYDLPIKTDNIVEQQKTLSIKQQVAVNTPNESPVNNTIDQKVIVSKQEVKNSEVAVTDSASNKNVFESKVDQVVNQIKNLKALNSQVSEAEVAALLDAAQMDLKTKSMIDPLTQKVDAMALLDEVEFDLERSFRDKVFDALGDGYSKIRTAMAERNN